MDNKIKMELIITQRQDLEASIERAVRLALEAYRSDQPKQSPEDKKLMSIKDVMAYTGLSYHWVFGKKDVLKAFKAGGAVRFRKEDVDDYINRNQIRTKK